MPTDRDRFDRYQRRRENRLDRLPALRHVGRGTTRTWHVGGELLVLDEMRQRVEQHLVRSGVSASAGDEEIVPGLRRYRVRGFDVQAGLRAMRAGLPGGTAGIAANHVFLSAPFNHGGPFGPPQATAAAVLDPCPPDAAPVPVTIIDTGLWADTALPTRFLHSSAVELETATDVDEDGILDGDVGHANFIGGVIARHEPRAALRVLKVLDTFGVCTEAELVGALDRMDPQTQVVNLSLGGFTEDGTAPLGLGVALENALSGRDRVVVAAAGNDGNRTDPFWPAAFAGTGRSWSSQVVAVAAHDGTGMCGWSNAGDWVTFAAPGEDVTSTFINHPGYPEGWAMWSGTSFAAPRVAAAIAARITGTVGARAALRQLNDDLRGSHPAFDGYPTLS